MNTVKMIAKSKFPSRNEIQKRMERCFPTTNNLLQSIIAPCAEEAERIMLEVWIGKTDNVKELDTVFINKHFTGDRCTCPNCYSRSLFRTHRYCPKCGSRVIWAENHLKTA